MNYNELITSIANRVGDSKSQTERVIDTMIDEITEQMRLGEKVILPELGIFKVDNRPARDGRNPLTGDKIRIPAKRRVKFAEAKALKEVLNPVRLTGAKRRA